jgi:hypothetical protein
MLKSTKITLMVAALWPLITTKLPTNNLRTHQTSFQSSRIIPILKYILQNSKENPIIHFVSQSDLCFSGIRLKSTKIALVVAALWLLITTILTGINLPTHQIAF